MSNNDAKTTGYDHNYHDRQFASPYQSIVSLFDWLVELRVIKEGNSSSICDLSCGKGANLYYMARRFPESDFTGLDIGEQLIRDGNGFLSKMSLRELQMHCRNTTLKSGEHARRRLY